MKLFNHVFSIAAALALVGCGSGGGGGAPPYIDVGYSGPTTTVTITSTANIGSLVTAANGGVTTLASSVDTGVVAVGSAAPRVTVRAALAALSKLRAGGGTVVSGVTDSQTQACAVSGSVTLGYTMADPSGYTVSAGDRFSVTFNACNDGPGYGIIAGSETVIVGASPGGASFFSDPTTMAPGVIYSMTVLISDFVIVDDLGYYSGIDGDMTVAMTFTTDDPYATSGWLTSSESGSGISFEAGFDKVATESAKLTGIAGGHYSMESGAYYPYGLYDWPSAYSSDVSVRLCSTEMGGCLNVQNSAPFIQGEYDSYPSSGTIEFSDDSGHFIELTATNSAGNVTIYYDIGAGTVGPVYTTWMCLNQADSSGCFP